MPRAIRLLVLMMAIAFLACASKPDAPVADFMFSVDARAADRTGAVMRDVRVSIQLLGPPVYDVITPVSEQVGYTNSEGVVHFFFISHEPEYRFNLIFFKEGFRTVWLEGLSWTAPTASAHTAVMEPSP